MPAKRKTPSKRKPAKKSVRAQGRPAPKVVEFTPDRDAWAALEKKPVEVPSGPIVATARAFNPKRVGWAKTAGAVALVLIHIGFLLALEHGALRADGAVSLFMAGTFGPLVGLALRHLGNRYTTDRDSSSP